MATMSIDEAFGKPTKGQEVSAVPPAPKQIGLEEAFSPPKESEKLPALPTPPVEGGEALPTEKHTVEFGPYNYLSGAYANALHAIPGAEDLLALAHVGASYLDSQAPTLSMEEVRQGLNRAREAYNEKNPSGKVIGETAGFALPLAIGLPTVAQEAANVATLAKTGALEGALWGAAYGAGDADKPLTERAAPTVAGTAAGAAIGAGAPLLGSAVRKFIGAFHGKSPEQVAGDVLNKVVGEGAATDVATREAPDLVYGARPTLGQETGNPYMLAFEKRQAAKAGPAEVSQRAATAENKEAIQNAVENISTQIPPEEASKSLSNAIAKSREAMFDWAGQPWKQVNIDKSPVDVTDLGIALKNYMDGLSEPARRKIAETSGVNAEVQDIISRALDAEALKTTTDPIAAKDIQDRIAARSPLNFRDVDDVRKFLGDAASKETVGSNEKRILNGLRGTIASFTDDPVSKLGTVAIDPLLYASGKARTKLAKSLFNDSDTVNKIVNHEIEVPEIADALLSSGRTGIAPWQQAYNAVQAADSRAPQLGLLDSFEKAAKGAMANKILGPALKGLTEEGEKAIDPNRVSKLIDSYSHVINSPLYSPEERAILKKVANSADILSQKGSGPITEAGEKALKSLEGDKTFADYLAPAALRYGIKGGLIGAGAGAGAFTQLPLHQVAGMASNLDHTGVFGALPLAGAYMGSKLADSLLAKMYKAKQEDVFRLLATAISDPLYARELMRKASPGAEASMNPQVKRNIEAILAGRIAGEVGGSENTNLPGDAIDFAKASKNAASETASRLFPPP